MALLAAGGRQQAGELAVSAVTIRLHRLQVMRKMQVGSPN
jgi:FixJ family two-component response regulator